MAKNSQNNQVTISGKIKSEFVFDHEVYGEKFYSFIMEVPRLSEATDEIRCVISDRMLDVSKDRIGDSVKIKGKFKTFNKYSESKATTLLYVFSDSIEEISEVDPKIDETNVILLDGFICKTPSFRVTPSGREIADVVLAVNRAYGKSDYIPCIIWGRNARYVNGLSVGDRLKIKGRIQSRDYIKIIGDEKVVKTAYEVSVSIVDTNYEE